MTHRDPRYPGAPRWAKVLGAVFGVVTLLFFVMLFTRGPHSGDAHQQHRDAGGERGLPVRSEHDPGQLDHGSES